MKLSTKGNYGVRAAFELARHYGKGPLPVKQISERQDIPLKYLEQLLFRLKKGGIITSVRGPSGGYVLTDSPSNFSVGDVIKILEGPLQMAGCVVSGDKHHCLRNDNCISKIFWAKIEKRIDHVLNEISLQELSTFIGDEEISESTAGLLEVEGDEI